MPISKCLIPNSLLCLIPKVLVHCHLSERFMTNSKGLPTPIQRSLKGTLKRFKTSLSVITKWNQKPTVCTDGWGICWIQLLLDDLVKVSVHVRVWKLVILIVIVFLSLFQLLAYGIENLSLNAYK